jgi:hypothetical protein
MSELGRWSLGRGIFRNRRLGLGRDGGPRQWAGVSLRGLRRVLRLRSRACPRRGVCLAVPLLEAAGDALGTARATGTDPPPNATSPGHADYKQDDEARHEQSQQPAGAKAGFAHSAGTELTASAAGPASFAPLSCRA